MAKPTSTSVKFKFQTDRSLVVSTLSTEGEYAGNDAIVAFTRAFSAHVIIHQLNSPRWEITAPPTATPTSHRTLHIAYLNGDHYCSVLPITSNNPPSKIKSSSPTVSHVHNTCNKTLSVLPSHPLLYPNSNHPLTLYSSYTHKCR